MLLARTNYSLSGCRSLGVLLFVHPVTPLVAAPITLSEIPLSFQEGNRFSPQVSLLLGFW